VRSCGSRAHSPDQREPSNRGCRASEPTCSGCGRRCLTDWRYLALAAGGGLIAFVASRGLARLEVPIVVLDAVGLSVFAVMGAGS
jgi:hypothetical protein